MESMPVPRADIRVPQGFRKPAQTEGPALTADDRKRFQDAMAALSKTKVGSEGWILAAKDALPVLISGCKMQRKQAERGETKLTPDDKYFLTLVEKRIDNIVSDLTAICMGNRIVGERDNTDPHLAFLALDVLKSIGLIRTVAALAKESVFPDVRTLAVDHIINRRTVDVARGETIRIGGTAMEARRYYDAMLVDIIGHGFFDDAHARIVAHASESGDLALLQRMRDSARLPTTVGLIRTRLDGLNADQALDEKLAAQFIERAFGVGSRSDEGPAGAEVPAGATITTLEGYRRRKESDRKPPVPPNTGGGTLPAFILDDAAVSGGSGKPPKYAYAQAQQ